jgi:hypothetical protein
MNVQDSSWSNRLRDTPRAESACDSEQPLALMCQNGNQRSRSKSLKRLERVKRSDLNSSFDFCQHLQLLTPSAYFRVGRIVGRFVRRSAWLACHSKLVLPLWKSVKDWRLPAAKAEMLKSG